MTPVSTSFANMPTPVPTGMPPTQPFSALPSGSAPMDVFAQLFVPTNLAVTATIADATPDAPVDFAADFNPLWDVETERPDATPDAALSSIIAGLPPMLAAFVVPPKQVEAQAEPVSVETTPALPSSVALIMPMMPEPKTDQAPDLFQAQALLSTATERGEPRDGDADVIELIAPKVEPTGSAVAPLPAAANPAARIEAIVAPPQVQFELRQLDLARDTMWLDDLAKDIVAAAQSEDQLSFRLAPRGLGLLDVNLSTSDTGLSVRMSTSTEDARAILAAQQPRLLDELRGQGIHVAEAEVHTGDHSQPERNSRDPMPFIEVAMVDETVRDTPTQTRPQGRFA